MSCSLKEYDVSPDNIVTSRLPSTNGDRNTKFYLYIQVPTTRERIVHNGFQHLLVFSNVSTKINIIIILILILAGKRLLMTKM